MSAMRPLDIANRARRSSRARPGVVAILGGVAGSISFGVIAVSPAIDGVGLAALACASPDPGLANEVRRGGKAARGGPEPSLHKRQNR